MTVGPAQSHRHCVVSWMFLPPRYLRALGPDGCKLLLKVDNEELIEKCDIVARVPAVPYCQKHEGAGLTDVAVVEKLESLVNIVHDPVVGVDVEGLDVVTELLRRLQSPELDISAS